MPGAQQGARSGTRDCQESCGSPLVSVKPERPSPAKEYLRRYERRAVIEGTLVLLVGVVIALLAFAAVILSVYFAITGFITLFK